MIGIFDSGAGGMSVFREIRKLLPFQKYTYFADNAHCPYGEKSPDFIIERSRVITDMLLSKGADVVVIACNTATAVAISRLRSEYSATKFVGIEPALKPGALHTRSGIVGVLATSGTLHSHKYLMRKEMFEQVHIVESVGEGWVDLVEKGILDGPEAEDKVRTSVLPLLARGADCLVLGCTHYPFLMDVIRRVVGEQIQIIDPAPAVAKQVFRIMEAQGLTGTNANVGSTRGPDITLLSSGDPAPLLRIYNLL